MNVTTKKLDNTEFLATLERLKGIKAEVVTKSEMKDATIVSPALSNAIQLQRSKMQTPRQGKKLTNF